MIFKRYFAPAMVLTWFAAVGVLSASETPKTEMGTIHFPNSGAPEAQEQFIRGVLALHNFWFEEAEEAFKKAEEKDPDFALAYWGEAMSYNHPLWTQQDIAAARKTLGRLGKTRTERLAKAPTEREKAYLSTLEVLYGPGDKLSRDKAYSKSMRRLMERFPEDDEAKVLYALSLLGTVRRGDEGFSRQMKSAAILADVFKSNPDHPGVAHFTIHSFDDPEHAPLALDAAELYARIAPEAPHALHMPSHIFIQHGMWDRVVQSNQEAYAASEKWMERKNLSLAKKDFHSLAWGQYGDLQLGHYEKARKKVEVVEAVADKTGDSRAAYDAKTMHARVVVESRQWEKLPLPETSATTGGPDSLLKIIASRSAPNVLLAAGMSAVHMGDLEKAQDAANRLMALRDATNEKGETYRARSLDIMVKELSALIEFGRGRQEQGLDLAKQAAILEASMDPPSGPSYPLKPSHELYGELLLEAKEYEEAKEQFETALLRMPKRSLSLLGLGRAASNLGDLETASEAYQALRSNWQTSDPKNPDLEEVRGFKTSDDGN